MNKKARKRKTMPKIENRFGTFFSDSGPFSSENHVLPGLNANQINTEIIPEIIPQISVMKPSSRIEITSIGTVA